MKIESISKIYQIDYRGSFVEMMENASVHLGKVKNIGGELLEDPITDAAEFGKRFPLVRTATKQFSFAWITLEKDATTDEILAEMNINGFKPAKIEHLVLFAQEFLKTGWQPEGLFIALGSMSRDGEFPCILYYDEKGSWICPSAYRPRKIMLIKPGEKGWYYNDHMTTVNAFLSIKED